MGGWMRDAEGVDRLGSACSPAPCPKLMVFIIIDFPFTLNLYGLGKEEIPYFITLQQLLTPCRVSLFKSDTL